MYVHCVFQKFDLRYTNAPKLGSRTNSISCLKDPNSSQKIFSDDELIRINDEKSRPPSHRFTSTHTHTSVQNSMLQNIAN